MKKLVRGIKKKKKNVRPEFIETFAKLALGQSPDALFIACSDSRVVPNLFASTDPGDLFVVRNVGNLVPPCSHEHGLSQGCESAAAAIEYAVLVLKVRSIIVCGHSECGAMISLMEKFSCNCNCYEKSPNLKEWLHYAKPALDKLNNEPKCEYFSPHNRLSQLNVLEQIDHLMSYPIIQEKCQKGELKLYGWWFDIGKAHVYSFNSEQNKFIIFDEIEANRIIESLK